MDTPPKVVTPDGLGVRGERFWRAVNATYELDLDESELLVEVCRMLDDLDALREAISEDGVVVDGSKGQQRSHPALAELRQTRIAAGRLLAQLALPDPDAEA